MSEYWKSLPKKYCDFCKCWITDNKASRDFHERGLHHQSNVRKRLQEIQRNSSKQEKERSAYNLEIAKIEAAALASFNADVARDPSLARETNFLSKDKNSKDNSLFGSKVSSFSRFGECTDTGESLNVATGKARALETIAKAFEKKSKWLEAKTAEGSTYYWNKETLETQFDPPKSGYLSLAEQNQFENTKSASSENGDEAQSQIDDEASISYRRRLASGWTVVQKQTEDKIIDLQLPQQDVSKIVIDIRQQNQSTAAATSTSSTEQEHNLGEPNEESKPVTGKEEFTFKEKTVDSLKRSRLGGGSGSDPVTFKKRSTNMKRNVRLREND